MGALLKEVIVGILRAVCKGIWALKKTYPGDRNEMTRKYDISMAFIQIYGLYYFYDFHNSNLDQNI